jgi:microcystin-dependent protein
LDNRVTDGPNNGVGTVDGEQQRTIESNNLPDHAHSLTGDGGEQFFATTAVTGTTSTGSGVSSIVGGGPGSQTTQTGGMVNYLGNPLQTIPPFLTFEFIIYTGVHL